MRVGPIGPSASLSRRTALPAPARDLLQVRARAEAAALAEEHRGARLGIGLEGAERGGEGLGSGAVDGVATLGPREDHGRHRAGALAAHAHRRNFPKSGARFSAKAATPSRGLGGLLEHLEGVEGHPADPRDRLAVGVEGVLQHAQRRRALGQHLVGPGAHLAAQLGEGHHLVHEAPALHGGGVVEAAQVPDLAGALLAEDAREVGAAEAGVEGADARAGLAEARVVGGEAEVAEHVEHVAAADGEPVHRGDHRLRHRADHAVQGLDLEQAALARPVVAALLRAASGRRRRRRRARRRR